jgi:SNF2 family DNA or RNA helicase
MMLDDFQEEAISFIQASGGRAIYADDMGGRKTGTTATWLDREPGAQRVLVVVPRRVHVTHWINEVRRFAPRFVALYRGQGTPAQRMDRLGALMEHGGVYVTTYDAMRADENGLVHAKFDTVVFDEGHKLKGRTTAVAKVSNKVSKAAARVLCVTGTPILNHPEELWQYLHLLYPRVYTAFWTWAHKNFVVTERQFKGARQPTKLIGDWLPGREAAVREILSKVLIQRDLAELFPGEAWVAEPLHVPIEIELSAKERKLYNQLVEHAWGVIPGKREIVTAANRAVVSTRLEQITSDWGGLDDNLDNGTKVAWAADDITEWVRDGVPVITFCRFKETVRRLVGTLNKNDVRAVAWTSDTSKSHDSIMEAYLDGKVDVIVGTIASLAEGTDGFQYRTHKVAMLDRHWTAKINEQCIGRVRRSGQTKRTEVRHYFMAETVEQSIVAANLRKLNFERTLRGKPLVDVIFGRAFTLDTRDNIEVEDLVVEEV